MLSTKAGKTKDELITEKQDEVRVSLMRFQGNADGLVQQCVGKVNELGNEIGASPTLVVSNNLEKLGIQQLTKVEDNAEMNNYPLTITTLAKTMFNEVWAQIEVKESEMKYLKEALKSIVEMAFLTQYHNEATLDLKGFKKEVKRIKESKIETQGQQQGAQQGYNHGYQQAMAVAEAKAKAAPPAPPAPASASGSGSAPADVPMPPAGGN